VRPWRCLLFSSQITGTTHGRPRYTPATAVTFSHGDRVGVDACVRYLATNEEYLRYDEALASGWPIATGVIEGAARHLIGDGLDIAGSRWGVEGAEAILRLRAVIDNGDFEAYWAYHLRREHDRVHQACCQDGYDLIA
jgi:hypothetical protein